MRATMAWTVLERSERDEETNRTRRSMRIADTTSMTVPQCSRSRCQGEALLRGMSALEAAEVRVWGRELTD